MAARAKQIYLFFFDGGTKYLLVNDVNLHLHKGALIKIEDRFFDNEVGSGNYLREPSYYKVQGITRNVIRERIDGEARSRVRIDVILRKCYLISLRLWMETQKIKINRFIQKLITNFCS